MEQPVIVHEFTEAQLAAAMKELARRATVEPVRYWADIEKLIAAGKAKTGTTAAYIIQILDELKNADCNPDN